MFSSGLKNFVSLYFNTLLKVSKFYCSVRKNQNCLLLNTISTPNFVTEYHFESILTRSTAASKMLMLRSCVPLWLRAQITCFALAIRSSFQNFVVSFCVSFLRVRKCLLRCSSAPYFVLLWTPAALAIPPFTLCFRVNIYHLCTYSLVLFVTYLCKCRWFKFWGISEYKWLFWSFSILYPRTLFYLTISPLTDLHVNL